MEASHVGMRKLALREEVLAARRSRGLLEGITELADHALAWQAVRRGATVAAYVSIGREPGTGPLLDALLAAGKRVILPVLMADNDLDWALYTGPDNIMSAVRGLLEPGGARLGVDAIRTADVVFVPGLAVSSSGVRLGRGGGSYDRALARVSDSPVAVVLHDAEVGLDVPAEPHDRPVTHALTPSGVLPLG